MRVERVGQQYETVHPRPRQLLSFAIPTFGAFQKGEDVLHQGFVSEYGLKPGPSRPLLPDPLGDADADEVSGACSGLFQRGDHA